MNLTVFKKGLGHANLITHFIYSQFSSDSSFSHAKLAKICGQFASDGIFALVQGSSSAYK